jgi:hypothetical protein
MSSFPITDNPYYGIDYQNRPGANDLSWYKNVGASKFTWSYQTQQDFFGGYDFQGGRRSSTSRIGASHPKKRWTWGDRVQHAWDRELTIKSREYVELMAGVYTDNQRISTYAAIRNETFSQFWWPIRGDRPEQATTNSAPHGIREADPDDRTWSRF